MNFNISFEAIQAKIVQETIGDDNLKALKIPTDLTDLNPPSKWLRITNAVARALHHFIADILINIYDSIFPQSADKYALTRHLAEDGLVFKEATKAEGTVRLGSSTQPTQRIEIPQGALPKTAGDNGLVFETLEGGYIDQDTPQDGSGNYTAPFTMRALEMGAAYNVSAHTVTKLEESIDDIDVIDNPNAISGGADEESMESALQRLKDIKKVLARGTKGWFKSEAEKISGVHQAIVVPRYGGRGTVGILVIGEGGPAPDPVLQEVQDRFNTDEEDPAGAHHAIVDRPQTFSQNYTIRIWHDPARVPIDDELDDVLEGYFLGLNPGQDQVLEVIEARLISYGMKDAKVQLPTANVIVPESRVSVSGVNTWIKEAWIDG